MSLLQDAAASLPEAEAAAKVWRKPVESLRRQPLRRRPAAKAKAKVQAKAKVRAKAQVRQASAAPSSHPPAPKRATPHAVLRSKAAARPDPPALGDRSSSSTAPAAGQPVRLGRMARALAAAKKAGGLARRSPPWSQRSRRLKHQ